MGSALVAVALCTCGIVGVGAALADQGADYAPEVRYDADGTAYQLSPSEEGNPERLNQPDDVKPYNTYWLKSDERGCNACHENLGETVENMADYTHLNILGTATDVTVEQCNYCHVGHSSSQPRAEMFGSVIHAIHSIGENGSDSGVSCFACHDANENGMGTVLWDDVKYDRMIGFTSMDAEAFQAASTFTWDQERVTPIEGYYDVDWQINDLDRARFNGEYSPLDEDIFNNWTFAVDGAVDEAVEFNLTDLIDEGLSVTEKVCTQCVDNPTGGGLLGQVEVTGIPLASVLEKVGVQDDANMFIFNDVDGASYYSLPLDLLDEADVLLVYEINGERLPSEHGAPLYAMVGGQEAYKSAKQCAGVTLLAEPEEAHYSEQGLNYSNTPNIGELDTHEGQIIEAGQPYTFGGYAYAYNNVITGVEFSLDRGETWVHYDVEGANYIRWVSWYLTFTPEEGVDTAYVLSMRSIMEDGTVGQTVEKMVNVKASQAE